MTTRVISDVGNRELDARAIGTQLSPCRGSNAIFAVLATAFLIASCTSKSAPPTLFAQESSRFLKGGESYTANIDCRPSEKTLIRVHQDNIDVTLELLDGFGTDKQKVDFPSGRFGDEFLTFTCGSSGHHKIQIQNVATAVPGGTVDLAVFSLAGVNREIASAFDLL